MQNVGLGRSVFFLLCIAQIAQFTIAPLGGASSAPAADGSARACIGLIQEGKIAEALKLCDPSTLPNGALEALQKTQDLIPKGSAVTIELVNNTYFKSLISSSNRLDEQLAYHVRDGNRGTLILVSARTEGGKTLLTGFRVEPAPLNLRDRFPFKLSGMSGLHYLFLALAVVIPLFMLTSAVACIRSRVRRRWLWVIFILVGVGKVSIVWTGSDFLDTPLLFNKFFSFQILGAGVVKYPIYDPWLISVSLPLGAILFWRKVRTEKVNGDQQSPGQAV